MLKYICVQPRLLYYAWQVETMINNFIKYGVNPHNIEILIAYNKKDETSSPQNIEIWDKLITKYQNVKFFLYKDTRPKPIYYISSIRPNILKQHFKQFPRLENENIFYHDCDILFTSNPKLEEFTNNSICYLSNTNSYINYDYIISKGEDIYNEMCNIIGIDKEIPKLNNSNSGGAQYILKNINYKFWEKVEIDCEKLYYEISILNNYKTSQDITYHPIQIWCADMWAVLWNLWLLEKETKVIDELDFCWATDNIERWSQVNIYHNAGVTEDDDGLFYKGKYINNIPNNLILEEYDNNRCSYNYVKEIISNNLS